MAKILFFKDVTVLKSSLNFNDIKQLESLNPEALVLRDDNGEALFRVSTSNKVETCNQNGITFRYEEDGKAIMTEKHGVLVKAKTIREAYGLVLLRLKALEAQIESADTNLVNDIDGMIEEVNVNDVVGEATE